MEYVTFKPWVGKNYENGGIFGKRILVLGESHHCGGDSETEDANGYSDFTINVVRQLLLGVKGRWTPTFRKFERSLVGHETNLDESIAIWNSVVFYNYIQKALPNSRMAPEWGDDDKDETAFFEVLCKLQPDLIIAWGVTRMYDNMPSKGWEKGEDIIVNNRRVKNGWYAINSGKHIRIMWVYHPSSAFSWKQWYNVIKYVL